MISLSVGDLEIDWAKNWLGNNHSKLFLPSDRCNVAYQYADNYIEEKPAFSRPLQDVRRRLGLLGYTLPGVRRMYDEARDSTLDRYDGKTIDFDTFARVIATVDAKRFRMSDESEWSETGDYDPGEYVTQEIFPSPEFNKVLELSKLSKFDGLFFENLDPYAVLRLLLEGPSNKDAPLVWRFADVVEGGWVDEKDVDEGLQDSDRYLVVTEGSSDAAILAKSAHIVAPDIADFFYFIDMSDNYPFTGTGNVFRFCQGLAKIRIQNRVLVVLDNDAAGCETLERLHDLSLPANMQVAKLPDLPECRAFPTVGPSGSALADINGQAVSIEMFLDLTVGSEPEPAVRWTSFNDRLQLYQGELVHKEEYTRRFVKGGHLSPNYDFSKLKLLWDSLYDAYTGECQVVA